MKKLFLSFGLMVAIGLLLCFTTNSDNKAAMKKLTGTNADLAPYNYGKDWCKHVFAFKKRQRDTAPHTRPHPELKMQVFAFRTVGTIQST